MYFGSALDSQLSLSLINYLYQKQWENMRSLSFPSPCGHCNLAYKEILAEKNKASIVQVNNTIYK